MRVNDVMPSSERPSSERPSPGLPSSARLSSGRRTLERERRFGELYEAQVDRARRLAWRLVDGDTATAEDVVQDAFVKAYRGFDRFRGDAQLSSWLHRIVVNEAHRHRRWREVRRRLRYLFVDEERDAGSASADPVLRDRIAQALASLSRGQREAFVLVVLESMTMREASTILGRSEGTIKQHLHRARASLRAQLADLRLEP